MTSEGHYCSIHDTVFFMRGKMRGFAHPVKDENGNDTGNWCNEEDLEKLKNLAPQPAGEAPVPPTPQPKDARSKEIGEHVGLKELGNRVGDGSIDRDFPKSSVKIKGKYYQRVEELTGIKFKEEEP